MVDRFGGSEFPPHIYFKIFLSDPEITIQYISGKTMIRPASEVLFYYKHYIDHDKGDKHGLIKKPRNKILLNFLCIFIIKYLIFEILITSFKSRFSIYSQQFCSKLLKNADTNSILSSFRDNINLIKIYFILY